MAVKGGGGRKFKKEREGDRRYRVVKYETNNVMGVLLVGRSSQILSHISCLMSSYCFALVGTGEKESTLNFWCVCVCVTSAICISAQ